MTTIVKRKIGKPNGYKKLHKRRAKVSNLKKIRYQRYETVLAGRTQSDEADVAAYASVLLWQFLGEKLEADYPNRTIKNTENIRYDKDLVKFFSQISLAKVEVSEVVNATEAYTFDKFESRMETMFLALLNVFIDAEERQRIHEIAPTFFRHTQHPIVSKADMESLGADHIFNNSKMNVVSVGGGPGNDLVGAVAFFSVFFDQYIKVINATSFDFATSWNKPCSLIDNVLRNDLKGYKVVIDDVKEKLNESEKIETQRLCSCAVSSIKLTYEQCNLKSLVGDKRNRKLLETLDTIDLILFSYVVYETNACDYALLSELFIQCKRHCIFVFLDLHKKTIEGIEKLVQSVEKKLQQCTQNSTDDRMGKKCFEILRCGSHKKYPFKGIVVYRL